ncbi:MAG: dihydroneopterin aldolase, partial [Woeseia sp.]
PQRSRAHNPGLSRNIQASVMDSIFLQDLRVETIIGICAWERKIRQTVSIDLEIGADGKRAAESDSVDDALDYKMVAKRVQQFVAESSFQLVETLAERIADIVIGEFKAPWVEVRVSKPGAIRGAKDVGIRIRREKNG